MNKQISKATLLLICLYICTKKHDNDHACVEMTIENICYLSYSMAIFLKNKL